MKSFIKKKYFVILLFSICFSWICINKLVKGKVIGTNNINESYQPLGEQKLKDAHDKFLISFILTRQNYEDISTLEDRAERNIELFISKHGQHSRFSASITLWGTGSFSLNNTERRSYLVKLKDTFQVSPTLKVSQFILLSLFEDEARIKYYSTTQWLSKAGLWPFYTSYVHFKYQGYKEKNAGVYLFIHHPGESLRMSAGHDGEVYMRDNKDHLRKFSDFSVGPLDSDYQDLLATREFNIIQKKLNAQRYLDWISTNTILQNGDYLDEAIFFKENGKLSMYGWDYDSIREECHTNGKKLSIDKSDPKYNILWCPQSKLDSLMMEKFWPQYIASLYQLLKKLTPDSYCYEVNTAVSEFQSYLKLEPGMENATFENKKIPDINEKAKILCNTYMERYYVLSDNVLKA